MTTAIAFAAGVVFAIGLGLGGMTRPARILAFLDVTGRWDPTLALVMAAAVAVAAALFAASRARGRPVLAEDFDVPKATEINRRLVGGAILFGVGWGLSGYCPGPAIVSLAHPTPAVLTFVVSMLVGIVLGDRWARRPRHADGRPRAQPPQPGPSNPLPGTWFISSRIPSGSSKSTE